MVKALYLNFSEYDAFFVAQWRISIYNGSINQRKGGFFMDFKKLYIDGQWVAPLSGQYIDVENPATKEVFKTVAAAGEQDVAAASAAAAKAFPAWAARPMEERIDFMRKLLKELIQFEPQMVDATVKELGIPVSFVKTNHIAYQFVRTQSYIDLAPDLPLVEKLPQSVVYRRPLGVIGCITPWNYPWARLSRKSSRLF